MQNNNTITKTQNKVLFPLGRTFLTIGAEEALEESNQQPQEFLAKHQTGDWGVICAEDKKENEFSLTNGFRLMSAYKTANGTKIWVITEADKSATTILLPNEY
ncbi:MAG TPA: hypothetical protein VF596_13375 [Pyrinomonadaceae bacterium]|jgi:invasion protein IalB